MIPESPCASPGYLAATARLISLVFAIAVMHAGKRSPPTLDTARGTTYSPEKSRFSSFDAAIYESWCKASSSRCPKAIELSTKYSRSGTSLYQRTLANAATIAAGACTGFPTSGYFFP